MNAERETQNAERKPRRPPADRGFRLPGWFDGAVFSRLPIRAVRNFRFPRSAFRVPRWLVAGLLFAVLTLVTQVGGLLCVAGWWLAGRWWQRERSRAVFMAGFYLISTLWIVPVVARPFGRVPLPLAAGESKPLVARAPWFWLTNRHYVHPELKGLLVEAARQLRAKYPGSVVHYLDAGFPFGGGFVMLPHKSHRSGKVVDLTFCYRRGREETRYGASPSPIGYGIYDGPKPGESQPYRGKSSWLRWDFPWIQKLRGGSELDRGRTRDLVRYLLEDERTAKVLLETHLQERLGLSHSKLRTQQLHAARHDDHLHVVGR